MQKGLALIENFREQIEVKGHFRVDTLKNGVIIDTHEEKNLIMDSARNTFARYSAGMAVDAEPMNKLVLGTKGHIGTDINAPKTSSTGFIPSLTSLFSEVSGTEGIDYVNFEWVPNGNSGAISNMQDNQSQVQTTANGYTATFIFDIPENAGNGTGSTTFTEAAMYTGDHIFCMRTFKGRTKDDGVALRITWRIMY